MAIVYSYPIATPELQDLLVGTEMAVQGGEDSPRTRTFTIGSIIDLATGVITTSENGTMYSTNPVAGVPDVGSSNSIFLGYQSGNGATNAEDSNFIGYQPGYGATNAFLSNFIGKQAGYQASDVEYSIFIGYQAGYQADNAYRSNFFGNSAGAFSTGNNVNAFGLFAGFGNALSGQTIFSNSSLPSYTNRAAAVAAITVLLGASAGSTYLYYNETTFGIEAVRL